MTMDANPKPTLTPQTRGPLMILTALLALLQVGAAFRALQVPDVLAAQISLPLPLEAIVSCYGRCCQLGVLALLWRRRTARHACLPHGWQSDLASTA